MHLIIESLATNSIHERDVANNYTHLRAKEKMSAFQNDRDRCSSLSSYSNCPQTQVMTNLNGKKVYLNWNKQHVPRTFQKQDSESYKICRHFWSCSSAHKAVLFAWKNPDLNPWFWGPLGRYTIEFDENQDRTGGTMLAKPLLSYRKLQVVLYSIVQRKQKPAQESWKGSLIKQESKGSYC